MRRELLMSAVPDLFNVAMKKNSPKQALKKLSLKLQEKQLGGGRRRRKTPMNRLLRRRPLGAGKRKKHSKKKQTRRSRAENDYSKWLLTYPIELLIWKRTSDPQTERFLVQWIRWIDFLPVRLLWAVTLRLSCRRSLIISEDAAKNL